MIIYGGKGVNDILTVTLQKLKQKKSLGLTEKQNKDFAVLASVVRCHIHIKQNTPASNIPNCYHVD